MCRLVVVEHEVDGVGRSADEDDLEDGVVERLGFVEGPEEVDVTREVDDQVEELRLERDTRCALQRVNRYGALLVHGESTYTRHLHLVQQNQDG